MLLVHSCGWGFATRTRRSTTSTRSAHATTPTQTDPSITSTSQICHAATIVVTSISCRYYMGDWTVSQPRVKSSCTHLLDQERSRERAVGVAWVKYNCFSMKTLQATNPGKVDEYKAADLLIVRNTAIILELRLTEGTQRMKKR